MWTFWIRMIRLKPRRKPRRGICHIDFEVVYRPHPDFPKHSIEVRPIPESSDPTQGVQAKCQGPWAHGPRPKGPGPGRAPTTPSLWDGSDFYGILWDSSLY